MADKSYMEKLYEEYLTSEDRCIEIDGVVFYKIIDKSKIFLGKETVLVCVPWDLFDHTTVCKVRDEHYRLFQLGACVHSCFHGAVPEWYVQTATVPVEGICEVSEIGEYLTRYSDVPSNQER